MIIVNNRYIYVSSVFSYVYLVRLLSVITLDNVQSPFYCMAVIGGTQYGHGYGSSKKIAKRAAGGCGTLKGGCVHQYIVLLLVYYFIPPSFLPSLSLSPANATLHLFLPHFTTQLSSSHKSVKDEKYKVTSSYTCTIVSTNKHPILINAIFLQFLSTVNVCDPKAADILAQAGLASPWSILRECCQRLYTVPPFRRKRENVGGVDI